MAHEKKNVAAKCLQVMLKPIARFCLRNSLAIQEIVEALKVALIEEAMHEVSRVSKRVSVSRLSVVTGLHRRDVMRLTRDTPKAESPASLASRVIGQWTQDKRFQSAEGAPKVLSYEGDQCEFKDLVRCVSKDLNHCTLLFELERTGAVEKTRAGVKLKKRSFVIGSDMVKGLEVLAQDSDDLMSAVMENLMEAPSIPQLHARTEYDNVSVEALPRLREWLLKEGSAFHKRMREYISKHDLDIDSSIEGGGGARVSVGTFGRVMVKQ